MVCVCVCIPVESVGGIYSIPKVVPRLGHYVFVTKDGQTATTLPTDHTSWPNQFHKVGASSAAS
jgi:hypothetical protein